MKVKYLLLSLLACAGFAATSCTEEDPIFGGDEVSLKVDPSIILVGKDGGSKTIDINAAVEWKAEPKDSWITISSSSGSGPVQVTVTVAKNDDENARQSTVVVTAGPAKMNITVKQDAGGVVYGTAEHPYPASKALAYVSTLSDGEKTDDIYITGIISKIDEPFGTQYGNATFYITDDGKETKPQFEVYRALYIGNKKYDNEADKNISVGDKVVICGKCVNYKGNTAETSQGEAYVVSIEEGTMPVLELAEKSKAISAGDTSAEFDLSVKNLTAKWTVTPAEAYAWVKDYTKEGTESGKITITVDANTADDAREAKFTVASEGAQSLEFVLTQGGNVLPATIAEIKAGVAADVQAYADAVNFEANLKDGAIVTYVNGKTAYIEDATGAVCYYGSANITDVKAGDKISGKITGKAYWRYGTLQIDGLGTECTKGEATVTETEITLADLLEKYDENMARRVVIKGITVKTGASGYGKTAVITQGDKELNVYIQKDGVELTTDAEGDLIAYPGRYKEANQLLLWDNAWFSQTGGPVEVPEMYLNEFDCQNKKIEIYNATSAEVDMTGWKLIKDDGQEDKDIFVIPAALAKVPAKGFAVFTCKQADAANGPLFGLSGTKGFKIALMYDDKNQVDVVDNLTTIVTIEDGKSWGRETDGAENFVIFDTPTIGESNGTVPPPPAPKTIAELIAAIPDTATGSSSAATISVDFTDPATVTYVNGKNAYIEDATGAVILYMENHGLQAGVTIKGKLDVTAYWYQGMPELISYTASQETVTGTGEIPLTTVTIAELVANYDKYLVHRVKLEGVKVTGGLKDSDRDGEVQQGDAKIAVRAQLSSGLELTEGDEGNLICIPALYNSNKQVYYWDNSWWESTATEVPPTISVSDITNVPAEGVTDATTTVTFANNEGWTASVTPDGTVVTAASIDGTTIKYTVAANTATEARDGKITVALKKDGQADITKDIKVSQKAAEAALDPDKTYYKKVTAAPDDWSGKYLLVVDKNDINKAFKGFSSTSNVYGEGADVAINSSAIESNETTDAYQIVIAKATVTDGAYTIKFGDNFFVWTSGNSLNKADSESANSNWNITYETDHAVIRNAADSVRNLQWNASSPRFACYGNDNQTVIQLYKLDAAETGDSGSGIPDYDPITGFTW